MAKINGDQNANVLHGTNGRDTIKGLGGDDSLFAYQGNDILEGGTGADSLDGGDGIDRAEYRRSSSGVTVNLGLNFGLGGEAQGDTFTSIENVFGSRYADLLVGDGNKNVLAGRNGNDTLNGEGGADRLLGGNGDDTLNGGDDNDRLDGGRGADHLDGGDGTGDRAEYSRSNAGVIVDLGAGTGVGGFAQGDTLVNVENVLGSKHDDVLTGNAQANTLLGNKGDDELNGEDGDDILEGGQGGDEIDGGEGSDTASYARSRNAVQIDLAAGTAQGGDAAGDTLTNIENLSGSRKSDTLLGDGNANILSGNNGHDILEGRDGNDILNGGRGRDDLDGGAGEDELNGGRGRDTLDGGEGDDALSGGDSSDIYLYAKGDGTDTITDGGHKDRDVIKISGYDAEQTFVQRLDGSDDLLISFGGENGGDSIIVKNTLGGSTADTVEQVQFEDGTVWKIADVITRVNNEAPVAVDDLGSTILPDQPVVIPVSNMLSNDIDPDGDELSLVSVYDAEGGTVEITEDGDVVFTPEAGFSGTASFLYTVTDGTAASEARCVFDVEVEFSQFIGNWWAETIDLSASALPCYIDCGLGNDIATGSDLRDQILGAGGDDTLNGGGGNDDFLVGLGHGFDRFNGGDGYDVVLATEDGVSIGLIGDFNASVEEFSCAGFENVTILGTWQAQVLDFTGVTLTDIKWIDAGSGNDTVIGSAGDDVIIGGLGDDNLSGADGDDDFLVGPGHGFDTFDGGAGFDQILATADGTNIGFLGDFSNAVEEISANGFADVTITANWQSQTYDFSNVTLTGITEINMGSGNDTVIGSTGDDVLIGGLGNDGLTGGLGADTFVFADGDGQDVITDFNVTEDVVLLDEISGFTSFADVQSALWQDGSVTTLDFGDGQAILFEDTNVGDLTASNFDFLLGDL